MADLYDFYETHYYSDKEPISYDLVTGMTNVPSDPITKIRSSINSDTPVSLFKYDFVVLNFITKVIQQDLYTIIIDYFGKKTVVKAQEEKFDKEKGLMVCLLKYLASSKGYSDMMHIYPDNPKLEKAAIKGALISLTGKKDFDKFMKEWGE